MTRSSLLLLAAIPLFAQSGRVIDSGSRNFAGKYGFYWQTRLEPGSPPLAEGFGRITNGGGSLPQVDRLLLDRRRKVYFGYRVLIRPAEDGSYSLTFSPVPPIVDIAKDAHIEDPQSWRAIGPELKSTQTVRINDVISLPLMTNPDTGQRIVEYISIQQPNPASMPGVVSFGPPQYHREFSYTAGVARDFTINDAQLRFLAPRLQINGVVDESFDGSLKDIASPLVWLYVPHKGHFIFSLAPRQGSAFLAVGEIRGTSLTFKMGTDAYTITSAVPIAPADVPVKLYVLHRPSREPSEPFPHLDPVSTYAEDALTRE